MRITRIRFRKLGFTGSRRARRGSAIVEFALVAPILIMLSLAMVQFGIILNARISLTNLCRQVSRYAAIHGTENSVDSVIKQYAVDTGNGLGIKIATSNVTLSTSQNVVGDTDNRKQYDALDVTVTYDLTPKYFLPTTFFNVKFTRTTFTSTTRVLLE